VLYRPGKGFTLLELLVVSFIMAVVTIILFMSFDMIGANWQFDKDLVGLQQQVRLGMERMAREIRQSRTADINIANGGANIAFTIGGSGINYYVDGNSNLIRQDEANSTIMGNFISTVNFTPIPMLFPNKVKIILTGAKATLRKNLGFSLTEEVSLRN